MLKTDNFIFWVPIAIWFANQPDSATDEEGEKLLRVRLNDEHNDWDNQWVPPALGYQKLRREWRKHLGVDTSTGRKRFLAWCEKNTNGLDGGVLYRYEKSTRNGIGPPLRTNRPEALLANVGFAVLSKDPRVRVRVAKCKCGRFFLRPRSIGKPAIFCQDCRRAKLRPSDLSTARVHKFRSEQ
jgi:hypothetical protein